MSFSHRFRVRYAEVDQQAVVFNSRYLEYADVVMTEYWRVLGVQFSGEGAVEFHVVRAVVEYKKPIRSDEIIEGRAHTARVGNSSVTTAIELHGGENGADDLRASIEIVHVHVALETGSSERIPDGVRARLRG